MAFHFAGIRLEGREKYRIILTAELNHEYAAEARIPVEIRINEGSGSRRAPIHGAAAVRFGGQKNVEFDFEAPDIATVTDLRLAVPSHFNVRTALLFVRHRFYVQEVEGAGRLAQLKDVPLHRNDAPLLREGVEQPAAAHGNASSFRPPLQPQSGNQRNSWDLRDKQAAAFEPASGEAPAAPPRRRRLE